MQLAALSSVVVAGVERVEAESEVHAAPRDAVAHDAPVLRLVRVPVVKHEVRVELERLRAGRGVPRPGDGVHLHLRRRIEHEALGDAAPAGHVLRQQLHVVHLHRVLVHDVVVVRDHKVVVEPEGTVRDLEAALADALAALGELVEAELGCFVGWWGGRGWRTQDRRMRGKYEARLGTSAIRTQMGVHCQACERTVCAGDGGPEVNEAALVGPVVDLVVSSERALVCDEERWTVRRAGFATQQESGEGT